MISKNKLRTLHHEIEILFKKWPDRFHWIAGNAENHGNDGKFHESHQTLNQI